VQHHACPVISLPRSVACCCISAIGMRSASGAAKDGGGARTGDVQLTADTIAAHVRIHLGCHASYYWQGCTHAGSPFVLMLHSARGAVPGLADVSAWVSLQCFAQLMRAGGRGKGGRDCRGGPAAVITSGLGTVGAAARRGAGPLHALLLGHVHVWCLHMLLAVSLHALAVCLRKRPCTHPSITAFASPAAYSSQHSFL
jgi:hypothetical protein